MEIERLLRDRYGLLEPQVEPQDGPRVEPQDGGTGSRTWWVSVDGRRCYVATWVPDAAVQSPADGPTSEALPAIGGDRVLLVDGGSFVLSHCDEGPTHDDARQQRRGPGA